MITCVDLGVGTALIPYEEGVDRQRELHARVRDGRSSATLLLLEHEPVYTAGRRTEPSDHPVDGSPVVEADRGGRITWHGPGQLVGYPIVALPEPVDVVAWVRLLERVLVDVVTGLGAAPFLVEGRSGVWLTVDGVPSKVAAIGVRVAEGITTHGFALNCSNSLEPFDKIVPCGIRDAGVTTLTHSLGRRVEPVDVVAAVRERFEQALFPASRGASA